MKSTITQGVFTAYIYDVAGWPFYEVRNGDVTMAMVTKGSVDNKERVVTFDQLNDYTAIISKCWEELDKSK